MIPLVPLKLSDIFNGAFSTLGRYWKPLLGFGAAVFGTVTVVVGAAVAAVALSLWSQADDFSFSESDGFDGDAANFAVTGVLGAIGAGIVVIAAVLIATALMHAAVAASLQEAVLGRPVTFGMLGRRAFSRLGSLLGTVLLTTLIVLVPLGLLAAGAIVLILAYVADDGPANPGVVVLFSLLAFLLLAPAATYLFVRFSLASTIVVFENAGPATALRRSAKLVRGSGWRIFGIYLLGALLASTVSYAIQMPFSLLGSFSTLFTVGPENSDVGPGGMIVGLGGLLLFSLLGQIVAQFFSTTFPPLILGLLYVDRRIRTENLAAAMAEATGMSLAPPPYPYPDPAAPYGPSAGAPAPDPATDAPYGEPSAAAPYANPSVGAPPADAAHADGPQDAPPAGTSGTSGAPGAPGSPGSPGSPDTTNAPEAPGDRGAGAP
ncbi:hypothetical protein [uncultured Streptomyces sp.]|uniref:hypothetical protein n=1 Tax=uncultured Streptomyces sp. TaxID=174707 RepID=UPI00261AE22F|nr:hypothetical protein [uncultured Streptomyces sp.]